MNGIFTALTIQDEEVVELALKNLAEVPIVGYPYLINYIQKIGEITVSLLSSGSYTCIKYSLLFWSTICKEEIKRGANSLKVVSQCA